jgi:peptidoglycan/xylan/chitin deacetylase (PgdA/CDA1 family)
VFERQMQHLKDNNYRVISLADFLQFLNYNQKLPNRSVIITIDDGYLSTYDIAYPILKQFDYSAVIFVYTDFVGVGKSALSWDQTREMKDNGIEIGSHTLSHSDLTKKLEGETNKAYLQRVKREL